MAALWNGPVAVKAEPPSVPIVEEAASFVVVMEITPVESIEACRLLAASAEFEPVQRRDLAGAGTEGDAGGRAAAGGCDRQRLARDGGRDAGGGAGGETERGEHVPEPAIVRSEVVPVLSVSVPAATVEAVPVPVMPSIALSTLCTVKVLPVPMPMVTLPAVSVVEVVCAVENVIVLAVDRQDRAVGDGRSKVVGRRARGANQLGRKR